MDSNGVVFKDVVSGKAYPIEDRVRSDEGGLLEVSYDFDALRECVSKELFDKRLGSRTFPYGSGVWRFRELIHPLAEDKHIVSRPEGNTNLYAHQKLKTYVGASAAAKHEGENPTGSFKDRGMTVAITEAVRLGKRSVACASTGNTSASVAAYAAQAGLSSVVFIPDGEIAYGKLSQALAYGARALQIQGNFDDAMRLVEDASKQLGLYLLNSVNPWRIEGQKSIFFDLLQQRRWKAPDWVVVPAGNLGNISALGKAIYEMDELGLLDKIPRVAGVQAEGSNPFYRMIKGSEQALSAEEHPKTVATAIKIGNPVSWQKAKAVVEYTGGAVESVSDQEIMDAKAVVDSCGIGCEPASAASVAGAKKLVDAGVISESDEVVCVLTGNLLKDPDATVNYHLKKLSGLSPKYSNAPVKITPNVKEVRHYLA
ncbi:Threonine synthase [uncultured archaeon]|nr:Threonine synthase [uncultured archaeon]